jgi:MarR family transcriptional regulator, organic hydroperoxide resistance regulator
VTKLLIKVNTAFEGEAIVPVKKERLTVAKPELLDHNGDGEFRRLLYNFFAFGTHLHEARSRFAALIGLSPTQYLALIVISRADPELEIGVSQVASQLHLSSAFVTIEVNKLASEGLVKKMPHSSDRRRVRLVVTPLGYKKLERLAAVQRPVNDALFATLDRRDFEHLAEIMTRLAKGGAQAIHLADHLVGSDSAL